MGESDDECPDSEVVDAEQREMKPVRLGCGAAFFRGMIAYGLLLML
jgi:hypothetical protein